MSKAVPLGARVSVYLPGFDRFIALGTYLGQHPSTDGRFSVLLDKSGRQDAPDVVGTLAWAPDHQWFPNNKGSAMDPVPYQHPMGADSLQVFRLDAEKTKLWPGPVTYAPGEQFTIRDPTVARYQDEDFLVFKTSHGDLVLARDLRFLLYQGG